MYVILMFALCSVSVMADSVEDQCPSSCQIQNLEKRIKDLESEVRLLKRYKTPGGIWF